jgi:hypothetical protein
VARGIDRIYSKAGCCCFSHGAAENRNDKMTGSRQDFWFLAPCSVEEARTGCRSKRCPKTLQTARSIEDSTWVGCPTLSEKIFEREGSTENATREPRVHGILKRRRVHGCKHLRDSFLRSLLKRHAGEDTVLLSESAGFVPFVCLCKRFDQSPRNCRSESRSGTKVPLSVREARCEAHQHENSRPVLTYMVKARRTIKQTTTT